MLTQPNLIETSSVSVNTTSVQIETYDGSVYVALAYSADTEGAFWEVRCAYHEDGTYSLLDIPDALVRSVTLCG